MHGRGNAIIEMLFDCVLFDIDGVLVDIRKSYNAAIKKTVEFVLKKISGKSYHNLVTDQIILKFRHTGGFNNDTDTSYAIILAMLANPQKNLAEARRWLEQVAENADERGYLSVEKFLSNHDIGRLKKMLVYPAPITESMMARIFDELFYGPRLFKKQNQLEPEYWKGRPLIKNDRVMVTKKTMQRLHSMFRGNIGIVSGRSRLAAEYSLGHAMMKYFNRDACIFLEDGKREHAKPNPYAIKQAMHVMNARSAIYAGDSAEDLMMTKRAQRELGVEIVFIGIYGYSAQPARTAEMFKQEGIEALVKSINQLPNTINKVLQLDQTPSHKL
jgi:phosphoglycolate phosphatase-like HAD superfamily hydrolase